jgi:hypothetical protein
MKPLLIALTLLASIFTQPLFATNRDVTPSVIKSFQSTFSTATDVAWTAGDHMYKARFVLNAQVVTAYYNFDGHLMAVTRHITSHQLPLTLQTTLKKGADGAWISELFELSNDEGTSYYVTLETADSKVVMKSSGQSWSQYSKSKKD